METIIAVLMFFVTLNCAMKISLWDWKRRLAFSAVLAVFVWWSRRYAMLQSKTQIADLLQDITALQNMAVLVTIESAVNFAFCAYRFGDAAENRKWWRSVLEWYPSLLVFPVMFCVLTQAMFMAVGVDFAVTSAAVAIAAFVLLPLLAEGMKRLVPHTEGRVEAHLLLSCLVCVLGLISTVTGRMIYQANNTPVDWQMASAAALAFVILFFAGFFGSRLKWKLSCKTQNYDKKLQTGTLGRCPADKLK